MKIRNGFVSNSSSSSFIIIGKPVNINDLKVSDIKNKNYVVVGKDLSDGSDIFNIDSIDIFYFLKTVEYMDNPFEDFEIFENSKIKSRTEDEIKFDSKDMLEGELTAISYWQDYRSCKDIEDLFDKYLSFYENENEFRSCYKKLKNRDLRKEKLEQIKN